MTGFNMFSMFSMLFISRSVAKIYTSSSMHSSFFWLLINKRLVCPRLILIPLVTSKNVSAVWLFSTVTTPSLPTCLYTSAIKCPSSLSLLADIVATSLSVLPVTFLDFLDSDLITSSAILVISRTSSETFVPGFCFNSSIPLNTIASVSTIAVVVPSPADVAVRSAASLTILTAKFSTGSSKLIALATVTPSLVTVNPRVCVCDSSTTVLPKGPSVLLTALDIFTIPLMSLSRPSWSKNNSFIFHLILIATNIQKRNQYHKYIFYMSTCCVSL